MELLREKGAFLAGVLPCAICLDDRGVDAGHTRGDAVTDLGGDAGAKSRLRREIIIP